MTDQKQINLNEKWDIDQLGEEASQQNSDEIKRQILRGDESKGEPDARDNAGKVDSKETPQGREEAKNNTRSQVNPNG